jgi:hypothetical protein
MSASGDDPSLNIGSGASPSSVVSSVTSFISGGGQTGTLFLGGLFGVIVSVFTGGVNIIQSLLGGTASFIDGLVNVAVTSLQASILEPLGIVTAGAQASGNAVQSFGIAGILVAVGLVLATFFLITQFLQEEETSDVSIVPGFPDVPFFGVTEEGEDDS